MKTAAISASPANYSRGVKLILASIALLFTVSCDDEAEVKSNEPEGTPTVTTSAISSITATSAISGGSVSNDGGGEITAKGVVWSMRSSPTIMLTTRTKEGTSGGNFTSDLTGLSPGTKYYIRAYATNAAGTAYGQELDFTTLTDVPGVSSNAITNITSTTAVGGGHVFSNGGSAITAKGVVWDLNPSPTVSLATKTINDANTYYTFTSNITGLSPSTTYYVRAYATNSIGTVYGEEFSFITPDKNTITVPPSTLFADSFYKKYLDASGIPIISSEKVSDQAFYNVRKVVNKMLSLRDDVLSKMLEKKFRVAIMAHTEVTTDIPEHSNLNVLFPETDWNQYRGLGPTDQNTLTTCAEENVLCYGYPDDVYFDEDILIHEFGHAVHLAIGFLDSNINAELKQALSDAKEAGLWTNTYAETNFLEYFAEGVQCWFNVNAEAVPTNGIHNEINTRAELETYDPTLYNILKRYFPGDDEIVSCHQ